MQAAMSQFTTVETPVISSDWRRRVPGITSLLKHVLTNGQLGDVQFSVGRDHGEVKIFTAHKFILSLNSDVFDAMFNGQLAETGPEPIGIPEILPEAFDIMLMYMYTGSAEEQLGTQNVFQTVYCADKYNLPVLLELSLKFLNSQLKLTNCLEYLENVGLMTSFNHSPMVLTALSLLVPRLNIWYIIALRLSWSSAWNLWMYKPEIFCFRNSLPRLVRIHWERFCNGIPCGWMRIHYTRLRKNGLEKRAAGIIWSHQELTGERCWAMLYFIFDFRCYPILNWSTARRRTICCLKAICWQFTNISMPKRNRSFLFRLKRERA
ncbi:uncharacterized protein LOC129597434 isoform X2 [Paramacrobiotus metropolitanus]|uniref:uncharacterized protein LOC129597434 isoform X2 n=1 Tax=Paramacrobiotus metropolitanus TaxID=2943436 RepID=UPI0024456988|nr:uncharacterized protein LOC129597434 isoform X2 [Paramacrobiotus metropolitanus]